MFRADFRECNVQSLSLTDPEVSSSGKLPQPIDMLLGINTRQVATEDPALLLGGVPDQPL